MYGARTCESVVCVVRVCVRERGAGRGRGGREKETERARERERRGVLTEMRKPILKRIWEHRERVCVFQSSETVGDAETDASCGSS